MPGLLHTRTARLATITLIAGRDDSRCRATAGVGVAVRRLDGGGRHVGPDRHRYRRRAILADLDGFNSCVTWRTGTADPPYSADLWRLVLDLRGHHRLGGGPVRVRATASARSPTADYFCQRVGTLKVQANAKANWLFLSNHEGMPGYAVDADLGAGNDLVDVSRARVLGLRGWRRDRPVLAEPAVPTRTGERVWEQWTIDLDTGSAVPAGVRRRPGHHRARQAHRLRGRQPLSGDGDDRITRHDDATGSSSAGGDDVIDGKGGRRPDREWRGTSTSSTVATGPTRSPRRPATTTSTATLATTTSPTTARSSPTRSSILRRRDRRRARATTASARAPGDDDDHGWPWGRRHQLRTRRRHGHRRDAGRHDRRRLRAPVAGPRHRPHAVRQPRASSSTGLFAPGQEVLVEAELTNNTGETLDDFEFEGGDLMRVDPRSPGGLTLARRATWTSTRAGSCCRTARAARSGTG